MKSFCSLSIRVSSNLNFARETMYISNKDGDIGYLIALIFMEQCTYLSQLNSAVCSHEFEFTAMQSLMNIYYTRWSWIHGTSKLWIPIRNRMISDYVVFHWSKEQRRVNKKTRVEQVSLEFLISLWSFFV